MNRQTAPRDMHDSLSVAVVTASLVLALALSVGCFHYVPAGPSHTRSPDICEEAPFCMRAGEMERVLRDGELTVRDAEPTGNTSAGALRLLVELPGGRVVRIKWKPAAPGGESENRSPRRELAAYAVQKLFLDEADYVVPPVVARCMPDAIRRLPLSQGLTPTFEGAGCVLGVVSYWVEGVEMLRGVDEARFQRDAAYRRRVALLNVLTYLIDHHDTKPENFVIRRTGDPQAFSVDNGMAFSGWRTPRGWFLREWQDLVVEAVPAVAVARLRGVRRSDLDRLAAVAQLRLRGGELEPTEPEAPFSERGGLLFGIRVRGDMVQLGLTSSEIDGVAQRVGELLARVASGEVKTF